MKFEEYPYVKPNLKAITKKYQGFIEALKNAQDAKAALRVFFKLEKYENKIQTEFNTIHVRYTLNVNDELYQKANEMVDEIGPQLGEYTNEFNKTLLELPFRAALEKKLTPYYFKQLEANLKTFKPEIVPDLIEENKLTSEYDLLVGSAKIEFRGQKYNLSQLGKFTQDKDRETRKAASLASASFFSENETKFLDLYDALVHVRTRMAKTLGFDSFIELAYLRLGRLDYSKNEVKGYREQIKHDVVPLVKRLVTEQSKRIGIKKMKYYDLNLNYLDGNPVPVGGEAVLVAKAKAMYHDMSLESGTFFDFLMDHHLMDLSAREGKRPGGYMTYFPLYHAPFIFSNFNGTSGDVDVLTHEFGHAFQAYLADHAIKIAALRSPTLEVCEMHSMAMEFLTHKYMEEFFAKDNNKYLHSHVEDAIRFLPYGALVDEFQHEVFENPAMDKDARMTLWRTLEKEYLPFKDFDGVDYLERGGFWFKQSHIFSVPFYYIDYTIAQVVAFQLFNESRDNFDRAWAKYLHLCRLGGRFPMQELLKKAKLKSPFIAGNVKKAIKPLMTYLQEIKL
ncbi:MAG: M3 family oligoendopeptidase [Erysipelotrichaceae bacterium]|jgi:M3 family oligoendopeptidase|nr:M3 family oligoendopeptidase [Erysipelotrichaceae bacterium]